MAGENIRAKARELMHGKTCKLCHTTFGEHSEEQFDSCWKRLVDERRTLRAEGKIPGPKLSSFVYAGPISLIWGQLPSLRKEMADWPCLSCGLNKPMGEHSDDEFVKCYVQFAAQGNQSK